MLGCNGKVILIIVTALLLLIALIIMISIFLGPTQIEGIQAELVGAGGGIIGNGDNVIFDTVLNDQSDNISYDTTTGEFTITAPGNYNVAWWTAPDGAGPATNISFAVAVNGVNYSIASSPIVSVQLAADALVTVDTVPTIITLVNVTGEDVFVPSIPVQAGIVITK